MLAWRLQRECPMPPETPPSPLVRLTLSLFALATLVVLLTASWLRFLVPARQPRDVRDVRWLAPRAGR